MNELIEKLALQVGAGTPQSLYGRTDYIVMTEFELEKFAELIVRECIRIDIENPDAAPGAEIAEYFGVE